ncbi:MAG: heavy-metal-associated domain-containing protein [Akkermansiaceae bacterium]|nr:heavy-metal-associated domain-containing protein [Akkermansiaceae bacterium]
MNCALIPILLVSLITLVTGAETRVELVVKGLDVAQTSQKVTETLANFENVHLEKISPKAGLITLRFDDAKIKEAELKQKLSTAGVKITGHRTTLQIKGLVCQSCSNHLTHVLGQTPGITFVESISYLKGTATVIFDPLKTDETKIKTAIHTTPYKVVEPQKPVSPAKE